MIPVENLKVDMPLWYIRHPANKPPCLEVAYLESLRPLCGDPGTGKDLYTAKRPGERGVVLTVNEMYMSREEGQAALDALKEETV